MIVVADTSPPLHLARIRRLDLVPAVVGRVTIPRTVWRWTELHPSSPTCADGFWFSDALVAEFLPGLGECL